MDDLISTWEAAQILGVSLKTVHRLATNGQLQPVARLTSSGPNAAYVWNKTDVETLAQQRAS